MSSENYTSQEQSSYPQSTDQAIKAAQQEDRKQISALQDYISLNAASNIQKQLPNNRVQVVSKDFDEEQNRIKIRLKVHQSDQQSLAEYQSARATNQKGQKIAPSSDKKSTPLTSLISHQAQIRQSPSVLKMNRQISGTQSQPGLSAGGQRQNLGSKKPPFKSSNQTSSRQSRQKSQRRLVQNQSNPVKLHSPRRLVRSPNIIGQQGHPKSVRHAPVGLQGELDQLDAYERFIAKVKDQITEFEYAADQETETDPERKSMMEKVMLSNQTILAQLERLTQATKDQINKIGSQEQARKSVDSLTEKPNLDLVEDPDQMHALIAVDKDLEVAYRNLDKGRKRLKTVKSLVMNERDEAEVRDDLGDANYFKLREIQNQITFSKQEIAQLQEKEANMAKYKIEMEQRVAEYKQQEADNVKREADLRKQIRQEKAKHREMSMKRRDDDKEDKKLFSKFINAHDEKQILRSHVKQVETSPRSSVNLNPEEMRNFMPAQLSVSPHRSLIQDRIKNRSSKRQFIGRSVETMPQSVRAIKLKNKLQLLSPQQSTTDTGELDEELASLKLVVLRAEQKVEAEKRVAQKRAYEHKQLMKQLRSEIANIGEQVDILDQENDILRGEMHALEHGKPNGKSFSLKELDSFGNVNLRTSVNKSLVQDGGKLRPVKSPTITHLSQQVNSGPSNLSQRSKPSVGGYSNRSRLVVREAADGSTEMVRMKPQQSLRHAKASLDAKNTNQVALSTPMALRISNQSHDLPSRQNNTDTKNGPSASSKHSLEQPHSARADAMNYNEQAANQYLPSGGPVDRRNMIGVDTSISFTSDQKQSLQNERNTLSQQYNNGAPVPPMSQRRENSEMREETAQAYYNDTKIAEVLSKSDSTRDMHDPILEAATHAYNKSQTKQSIEDEKIEDDYD